MPLDSACTQREYPGKFWLEESFMSQMVRHAGEDTPNHGMYAVGKWQGNVTEDCDFVYKSMTVLKLARHHW